MGEVIWAAMLALSMAQSDTAMRSQEQAALAPSDLRREATMKQLQMLREKSDSASASGAIALEWVGDDFDEKEVVRLEIDSRGRILREASGNERSLSGFDGVEAWTRAGMGLSRKLAYAERDTLIDLAYLRAGRWLAHVDASLLTLSPETNEEHTTFIVRRGRTDVIVTFAAETGLPKHYEFEATQGRMNVEFLEYAAHDGRQVPRVVKTTSAQGVTISRIINVQRIEAPESKRFEKPESASVRAAFDASKPSEVKLRRTPTGHVLVDAAFSDGKNARSSSIRARAARSSIGRLPRS